MKEYAKYINLPSGFIAALELFNAYIISINMRKYIRDFIIGLFFLVVAFSYSVFFLLQAWFNFSTESYFHTYSAILAFIVFICFFLKFSTFPIKIRDNVLITIICVTLLFYITRFFYNVTNTTYQGFFLSMGVRFVPSVMAGVLVAQKAKMIYYVQRATLPFILLYTIILANTILTAESSSNMGLTYNIEGGMNYQTMSYYSAYALGLTMHNIVYEKCNKFKKNILICIGLLLLVMSIMTGGRGAFALDVVFIVYFGTKVINLKQIIIYSFTILLVYILFTSILQNNDLLSLGFGRIFNFWSDSEAVQNDGRWIRWTMAWNAFLENPLLGNGIGSVFYEVGFYSHNIFYDILCEGGIIGIGVFVYILIRTALKLRCIIKNNPINEIMLVIFLCSFVNLCFSNYYLSDSGMWMSIAYILSKPVYQHKIY